MDDGPMDNGNCDERNCALSVLLQRDVAPDRWGKFRWRIQGIVPEAAEPLKRPPERSLAHADARTLTWLWRGVPLRLHPDACDDYVLNLDGDRPSLFVICQSGADAELRPVSVSADQQDGVDAEEFDGVVFRYAMPAAVATWIAEWVPRHWKPSQRKGKRWQKLEEGWPT